MINKTFDDINTENTHHNVFDTDNISDGSHTFGELYDHRTALFIALCTAYPDRSWIALRHDDGSMYPGMFIAGIDTPAGQATYHCASKWWNVFVSNGIKCLDRAPEYDGHTSDDVIRRVLSFADAKRAKVTRVEDRR